MFLDHLASLLKENYASCCLAPLFQSSVFILHNKLKPFFFFSLNYKWFSSGYTTFFFSSFTISIATTLPSLYLIQF